MELAIQSHSSTIEEVEKKDLMVPIKSHPPDGELSEDTPNFSLVMDEKVEDSEVRVSESL